MADTPDERLRYLIGRLGAHASTALVSVDAGRIEELCHLILHELNGQAGGVVSYKFTVTGGGSGGGGWVGRRPAAGWHP